MSAKNLMLQNDGHDSDQVLIISKDANSRDYEFNQQQKYHQYSKYMNLFEKQTPFLN